MDKLSDHLLEVDPIVFECQIGVPGSTAIQQMWYQLPVECFSKSQQQYVDFLANNNYEFADLATETEP